MAEHHLKDHRGKKCYLHFIILLDIRQGSFNSVKSLVSNIEWLIEKYNTKSRPFMDTATADSILEKNGRLCKAIAGTRH